MTSIKSTTKYEGLSAEQAHADLHDLRPYDGAFNDSSDLGLPRKMVDWRGKFAGFLLKDPELDDEHALLILSSGEETLNSNDARSASLACKVRTCDFNRTSFDGPGIDAKLFFLSMAREVNFGIQKAKYSSKSTTYLLCLRRTIRQGCPWCWVRRGPVLPYRPIIVLVLPGAGETG